MNTSDTLTTPATEPSKNKRMNKWLKRLLIALGTVVCLIVLLVAAGCLLLTRLANAASERAGTVETWSKENGTLHENLVYDAKAGLKYDLFIPAGASKSKSHGACLFLHGGAWMGGTRNELTYAARRYAKAGYITATMDYSLISKGNSNNVFLMLEDIGHAIEALKAKTAELGYSVDKLALSGLSAGGHLAMLYGYSRAQESAIPIVLVSAQVACTDFHHDTWGGKEGDFGLVTLLTGKQVTAAMIADGEAEKLVQSISPLSFVTERTVPTIVAYGLKDPLVRPRHSEKLVAAFKERGVEHTAIEFPNSGHGLDADPASRDRYRQVTLEYLRRAFGY